MKFWQALPALLFFTATLHAQIPLYGGNPFWQPYYPGATLPPYYPQAYYPQPYGTQSYYQQWPYGYDPFTVTNNNESIDSLTRQVQQLNDEIRLLQAERAAMQAQQALQAQQELARAVEAPASSPEPPVILVFKNGQHMESQGYAVMGETLWVLTRSGSQRIALCSLDVAATREANLTRGVQFPDLGR